MKRTFFLIFFVVSLAAVICAKEEDSKQAFKDKMAVGFNVINRSVDVRFWPKNNFGLDLSAGLGYDNDVTDFNFGAGIAVPVYEGDGIFANWISGAALGLTASDINNNTMSIISIGINTGVEFEVFLTSISKNLSLSSSVGMTAGLRMSSTKSGDNTVTANKFFLGFANSAAVNSLTVRYYF
jgi:hypothetical protein